MIASERDRWRIAQQWLARLLELPSAQRAAVLGAAALDPALQARVQRLLDAADHPDPRLEPGVGGLALAGELEEPENRLAGLCLGDWELLDEIGRGGMSVVYRARRRGVDYEQVAAVKLLGLASLGSGGAARFEQERRVLATLRHPHIAALVDGGLADDGTPFLVMQLVDGRHIDDWCTAQSLGLAARVQLLVQVCEAVAHAHRNLVVHRDIKPGNILVTAAGVPVLLDFGIAKLLGDEADATRTGLRALTPGYAAPEQEDGRPVTTATDVFALGAVLRRLCAPFEPLPRDLRNVLALATRPEPERRYRDAHALGEDLRRWLRQQPVAATPDSAGYRLRMFLHRRRGVAIASAAAVLLLAAGIAATLWQAQRAAEQARRAEASRDFLLDLFTAADPERSGTDPSLSDLVARGMQRVDTAFAGNPGLHAEMAMVLGQVAIATGDHAQAATLLDGARQRSLASGEPLLQAEVLYRQGLLANARGAPADAVHLLEAALDVPGLSNAQRASLQERSLAALSYALENTGQRGRALALGRDALAAAEASGAVLDPDQRARLLVEVARLEPDPSRKLLLLQQADRWFGRGNPTPYERVALLATWAEAHHAAGDPADAILAMQQAVDLADGLYREPTSRQARLHNNLGSMLRQAGQLAASDRELARAEALFRAVGDDTSPAFASLLNNRGATLYDLDSNAEAVTLLEEAVTLAERHFGPTDPRVGICLANLARARAESGDPAAESDWQRAWTLAGEAGNPTRQVNFLSMGAMVASARGDAAALRDRVQRARATAAAGGVADGRWLPFLALAQARVARMEGQRDAARAAIAEGLAQASALGDAGWSVAWRLHRAQGDLLHEAGDASAAGAQYRHALSLLESHGVDATTSVHASLKARLGAARGP